MTTSEALWRLLRSVLGGALLAAWLCGCGADEPPGACSAELRGECIGVPPEALCAGDQCTDGVPCKTVRVAASDAELAAAVGQGAAGDCIALLPGHYSAVTLPGGVSLLGRSANEVVVGRVVLGDGAGAWLRGVAIEGGLDVGSATGVELDAVRIRAGDDGLHAGAGSSVAVRRSEIVDAALYGVLASSPASLVLERSIVSGSGGPGIWAQCAVGCDCAEKPPVTLDRVLVVRAGYVAVSLIGVRATLQRVDLAETALGPNSVFGAGLSVSGCSELAYGDVHVSQMDSYGVLIDNASAAPIGAAPEERGIAVSAAKPGLWVQRIGTGTEPDQSVALEGLEIRGCEGAGIGLDLAARGLIPINGIVADTATGTMPIEPAGGSGQLGIGLVWKGMASAVIDGLAIEGSGTQAFLIDGPVGAGSSLSNITLGGGDEGKGIVQQQVGSEDAAPDVDGGVPMITREAGAVSDVPVDITPPAVMEIQ